MTDPGAQGSGVGTEPEEHKCIFCEILDSSEPEPDTYIVWRGSLCAAVLNAYPYASGHVLVMPIRHVAEMGALTGDESAELWAATCAAVSALEAAYGPEGFNVGFNLGRAAGAGIPAHLHAHVVPRWMGDTNFMTALAEARVLPESLGVTWERLRAAWPQALTTACGTPGVSDATARAIEGQAGARGGRELGSASAP